MENFKTKLYGLLKKDARLWNEETKEFNETLLKDLVDKLDEKLIEILLSDKEAKEKFFIKIKDVVVLKQNELKFFIDENKLDNSYTQYQNKIGLRVGNQLLSERNEVVLDWPFKDCVLEGGMTKEDQKRNEIFFNEVLAKDEIDRLEDPKALVNWKRYTTKGEEKVKELKRDKDGTIRENLIIKGNNLLALHSLKEQFTGKVKLIYIDPPYYFTGNKTSDSFAYNTNFKLSTWLVFMKDRLKIARDLLTNDGMIFIQISDEGLAYLKVLLDDIFHSSNYVNTITVKAKASSGASGGGEDKKMKKNSEFILFYCKNKDFFDYQPIYNATIIEDYIRKHKEESVGFYYTRVLMDAGKRKLITEIDGIKVFEHTEFNFETVNNLIKNENLSVNDVYEKYFDKIFMVTNAQTSLLDKINGIIKGKNKLVSYEYIPKSGRDKGKLVNKYIWNKTLVVWFADSAKKADGQVYKLEEIGSLWTDISWGRLDIEGDVSFKSGKKPEELIDRIVKLGLSDNDIILDYHLGSGTTCAVAHKLGFQYIGIEQLDYGEDDSITRLNNVLKGDSTGISERINWNGGGNFISVELAKWNEEAKEKILKAKSLSELEKLFDELYERYFFNYNVKTKEFNEKTIKEEGFKKLSLNEQKKLFVEMLDMNQIYVNFSERADKKYNLSKEDIALSEEFYNTKK